MVRMNSASSLSPDIHPPIAAVRSPMRDGLRPVPGIGAVSSAADADIDAVPSEYGVADQGAVEVAMGLTPLPGCTLRSADAAIARGGATLALVGLAFVRRIVVGERLRHGSRSCPEHQGGDDCDLEGLEHGISSSVITGNRRSP